MKAGIITIYDNINYGNRLQNYAVQTLLKSHGLDVQTLRIYTRGLGPIIRIGLKLTDPKMKKRQRVFNKFTKENLPTRLISCYSVRKLKKLNDEFDLFFSGSDQVWNPYFFLSKYGNLQMFAQPEKRNSISASFGISSMPRRFKRKYAKGIGGFNHVSVREIEGKAIINELCPGKEVEVLADPTMMLTKEQWLDFAKEEKSEEQGYVLTYFLGDCGNGMKEAEKIAKENGLKVIHLNQRSQMEYFDASPQKFVKLFSDAKLVCTNSYHGCVFSVKFEKPFIIFSRTSYNLDMSSRIKSLLAMFEIENRNFAALDKKDYFKLDYRSGIQETQIKRGHDFIAKCIGEKP